MVIYKAKKQSKNMTQPITITTRGRYAVMAMVELAKAGTIAPRPLAEIAEYGGISLSYLEQLIAGLRRQGLVKSYRGPGGGYVLSREPKDIAISEILIAAEDSTPAKRNQTNNDKISHCEHSNQLWSKMGELLHATLNRVSLHDVLDLKLSKHPHFQKLFEVNA